MALPVCVLFSSVTKPLIAIGAPTGFGQEPAPEVCKGHDKVLAGAAETCGEEEYTCQVTCKNNRVKKYTCCCGEDCMEKD